MGKTKNISDKNQIAINDIMDNFDFHKVHEVMEFLNWTWWGEGTPEIYALKKSARSLLERVCTEKLHYCGTGGFMARKHAKGILSLEFNIEQWDTFE